MLTTRQPVLRRFWYPVMPVAQVEQGPQPFTLLAERIVLWKSADGRYAAMADRCPHRSSALSKGWVDGNALVCPYHGWSYDSTGACVRIPQRPDSNGLRGTVVKSFHCEARYGHLWVALDEPMAPIPDWSEASDPGYRRIDQFYERWNCAPFRLMENSFDNAHIHFVHRGTFGDINDPNPRLPRIERFEHGFVVRSDVPVYNNELQKKNLRDGSAFTVRHTTATWYLPFLRRLHIRYPGGLDHIIVTAATPVADDACQVVQFCFRNDTERDAAAADIIAFDRRVTEEDRAILESTDFDAPLDMNSGVERHMPSDQPGLLMRRMLHDLLAAHGEIEQTRHYIPSPPQAKLGEVKASYADGGVNV
jgi:phenylpropionate dioxygenase-like ring-hydroxylating dioxygenase large terminal subunit